MTSSTPFNSGAPHQPGHTNLPTFQDLLEALPFPASLFSTDGLCVAANAWVERLFQVPRSAMIGSFNLLSDPTTDERQRELFRSAAAGQPGQAPPTYCESSFPDTRSPDRPGGWIATSYLPLRDAAGRVSHVVTMVQDVTAQVEADQKVARMSLLDALVEQVPIGMAIADLEGCVTYANRSMSESYGYGAATIGMHIPQFVAPEAMHLLGPSMDKLFSHGQMSTDSVFTCQDGATRPTIVEGLLIRDSHGAPQAIAAIIRDMSEQRAREADLRTFKALVDNTPDAVAVIDLGGIVTYSNSAYRTMLGYDHDLVGMNGVEFLALEERARVRASLANLSEQRFAHLQSHYQRQDGSSFPVAITLFLQEAPNGSQQIISFVRDISAQQRAEEERVAFQEQIISAQQAALRELSTPLIPIADGVVAMPLIGSIDSGRAQLVIETLLNGAAELRAHTTILDITGVPVVDTQVANALLRAAQAVKLLGARVILTGIRPEVAQTLVGLGVDLSGISTRSTLQSGIADALRRVSDVGNRPAVHNSAL